MHRGSHTGDTKHLEELNCMVQSFNKAVRKADLCCHLQPKGLTAGGRPQKMDPGDRIWDCLEFVPFRDRAWNLL